MMEVSFRSFRLINRFFRKPLGALAYRTISSTAVQAEFNPELLNSFNSDVKAGGAIPVFRRALLFPSRIALQDDAGIYTYAELYQLAANLCKDISAELLGDTEHTISYLCNNDASHVITQWAIWMSGNIAVPLTPIHPVDMLKYFITDSGSSLLICSDNFKNVMLPIAQDLSKPLILTLRADQEKVAQKIDLINDVGHSNKWYGGKDAMLVYTSGTTSKPKGVVWTHSMLHTQIASLHTAWKYSAQDVVLHTLPLHHIHGQLNSLNASLSKGARIRMLQSFVSHNVWASLLGTGGTSDKEESRISVFHGVPAMYAKLSADYDKLFTDNKTKEYVRSTLSSRIRLMCAGSASLPETLFKKWEQISGIRLLERYGMSEAGMAISNPYLPVEDRTVGHVGVPLPGISAAIAIETDKGYEKLISVEAEVPDLQILLDKSFPESLQDLEDRQWKIIVDEHKKSQDGTYVGELLLRGSGVFTRYWNRAPKLDSPDFTPDGWFRTGDTASFVNGKFKILGRTSIDIIKTGGYKVSALQVESAILENPNVQDAAVLGINDVSYGEIVATVIVLKEKTTLTLRELKDEAGKKLAPYQLPKIMVIVDEMPRNAMGKLDKKVIREKFGDKLIWKKD